MSDPLSLSASIVGLVAFGLQTADYLYKYYATYRDRNNELANISDRLGDLVHSLQTISDTIQTRKWRLEEKKVLQNVERSISRCEDVIEDLQIKARKLQDRPTDKKFAGISAQGIAYPFRQRTLKKLSEDVNDFRDNLVVALQALQLRDHQNTQNDIEDIKGVLSRIQALQLDISIREWLNAPDATIDYNAVYAKRHPGTGQWFLQSSAFRTWMEVDNSFLWVYGFAGCGKSVLCSTAIQHVFRKSQSQERSAAAFFFFTFTDKSKQDHSALLRTLLLQLSTQITGVNEDLARLKDSYNQGNPPMPVLMDYLRQAITRYQHVYLFLDALDESPAETSRADVLDTIATMRSWDIPGLHLLVTSRDEPEIREWLDADASEMVALDEGEVDQDILRYVTSRIENDPRLKRWGIHCDTIKKHITERSHGVFRWAECQLQPLRLCPKSKYDLDQCLKRLPPSLDETYERMLLGIDRSCWERAQQMLMFLCLSSRPPTVPEVIDLLAIDLDAGNQYDPDRKLENAGDLLRICPGLITITSPLSSRDDDAHMDDNFSDVDDETAMMTETVRIAHFSVQEYLLSPRIQQGQAASFAVSESKGHAQITKACLIYLSDRSFLDQALSPNLLKDYSLAPFAAEFWHYHYRLINADHATELDTWVLNALTNSDALERWLRLHDIEGQSWIWIDFDETAETYASPAYYAASLGLDSILTKILLSTPADVNTQGGEYGTPLQAASARGYDNIVQILIDNGAEVNTCGGYHATALQAAAAGSHEKVVRMLLENGAKVNASGEHDGTALQAAAASGNEKIVQWLLKMGAHVNRKGGLYGTALQAASARGHEKIVELLLDSGAKVLAQEGLYGTSLKAACARGHEKIVKILIDNNANVNACNHSITGYSTALQAASANGNEKVVQWLLDKGAKVNTRGGLYGTALQAASTRGHEKVVQMLLDKGALVNAYNTHNELYRTAIQAASSNGHDKVVKILLQHGAELNPVPEAKSSYVKGTIYVRTSRIFSLSLVPRGKYFGRWYRRVRRTMITPFPPENEWPAAWKRGRAVTKSAPAAV